MLDQNTLPPTAYVPQRRPLFGLGKRRFQHQNLEFFRDITDDVEESDFVPYACLYNHNTIITKNGELCQTIKITGLNRESIGHGHDPEELRSLIRESLKRHVPNDSFAIWFHTIRKNTSVVPDGEFPESSYVKELNDAWIEQNAFSHQFVNEVFVTIVHEGQSARISKDNNFMRGLIPSIDLKHRNAYLDGIYTVLNETVEKILDDLKDYGALRLTTYKENGIYYSEQLRFLEKLINFVDRPMPVVEMDMSTYLTTGEITFAFNAMEVRTALGKRRFASILTLKEYKEASLNVIDQFLQLPMEFIVTQCVNFVNPQKVLFEFQELYNYQRLSEDPDISRLSELTEIVESNRQNPNDFGEQQLTIFILSDTVKLLEENIKKSIAYFAKYGMIAVREDIKFEETYWAQLPGNFVFVSRMRPVNTSHVAGFANLSNMPVGQAKDNHWGSAVTTFHTASGTPYYFNFHDGNRGHTFITGPAQSGKALLMHFLLAQSMKFSPSIYYCDVSRNGNQLIQSLGGHMVSFAPATDALPSALLNPFALSDNEANRVFIARWLGVLARTMNYNPTEADTAAINQAIEHTYSQPEANRHLKTCAQKLVTIAPGYIASISPWLNGGPHSHVFTANGHGLFSPAQKIYGFDLTDVITDPALQATCLPLLLQLITDRLDGQPSIIALEEGWRLLGQTHLAANIQPWLDTLTTRNALLLHTIEDTEEAATVPFMPTLAGATATAIYMPDDDATEAYTQVFGMDEAEFTYLELMERDDRHFLVKHSGETVVGEMNMRGLDTYMPALTGNANLETMP